MKSDHVFSQLILFALLWLVVLVHLTRSKCLVTAPTTPTEEPEPLNPQRHRANEPNGFVNLLPILPEPWHNRPGDVPSITRCTPG